MKVKEKVMLSEVAADTQLQNYFGTMEDNDAIQLLNNIKISYGLQYINKTKTQYKNLPVVAASTYLKYGRRSASCGGPVPCSSCGWTHGTARLCICCRKAAASHGLRLT